VEEGYGFEVESELISLNLRGGFEQEMEIGKVPGGGG